MESGLLTGVPSWISRRRIRRASILSRLSTGSGNRHRSARSRRSRGFVVCDSLRQRVAFLATGRTECRERRELLLRGREVILLQIELAQAFVHALVTGFDGKSAPVVIERGVIIAHHALGEAKIVQDVGILRLVSKCELEVRDRLRVLLVPDQLHGLVVVAFFHRVRCRKLWWAVVSAAVLGDAHGGHRRSGQTREKGESDCGGRQTPSLPRPPETTVASQRPYRYPPE